MSFNLQVTPVSSLPNNSGVSIDSTKPTTFSAIFKHVSPPTAVEHCLYCHLVHPKLKSLVITRGSFVEIYNVDSRNPDKVHLSWLYSTSVYEEIADIVAVRFAGDILDSLLLSFPEARVAVMNFCTESYELRTLSLHNYEFENLKSGRIHFTKPPLLRLDPQQRCAVMLVYDRYLAVLPFRRTESFSSNDYDQKQWSSKNFLSWQQRATAPLLSTFTTCLSTSTGEKINNVLDMQFLYGYYEPTLLVLYEPVGTWAGRVSARRDTCCIVALSFNLQKRTNPVIWFQEFLPFDCNSVIAVPQPIGGVVVLATNSVMYLKQTLPSCGLPLNCYAQISTNFPMRQDVPLCGPLSIDGCHKITLNDTQFLIGTRSGKLYLLSLWLEQATQTVTSLLFHEVGQAVPPDCMALIDSSFLFIGSRLCDSVLLRLQCSSLFVDVTGKPKNSICTIEPNDKVCNNDHSTNVDKLSQLETIEVPPTKSARVGDSELAHETNDKSSDNFNQELSVQLYEFNEVDVELYGETILNPPSIYREIIDYKFELVDKLINFGPMSQLTSGEVPCLAPGNTDPTDEALTAAQAEMHHVELVACIPRSFGSITEENSTSSGGILLLHTSVRPRGLTAFELSEYMSLWSLYGPPVISPTEELQLSEVEKAEGNVENNVNENITNKLSIALSPKIDTSNNNLILEKESSDSMTNENESQEKFEPETSQTATTNNAEITQENEELETTEISNNSAHEETSPAKVCEIDLKVDSDKPDFDKPMEPTHSYLLLTREDSTMILEVSHEIVELEVSGFNTTEMTVGAFNLGLEYIEEIKRNKLETDTNEVNSSTPNQNLSSFEKSTDERVGFDYPYILQVSPTSLRLLDGPKLIEYVQVTLEWRIHMASVADPYVLLCTEDDELFLVHLKHPNESDKLCNSLPKKSVTKVITSSLVSDHNDDHIDEQIPKSVSTVHLEVNRPKVRQVSAPLCFNLYHDRGGRLARWLWACKHISPNHTLCKKNDSVDSASFSVNSWPEPDPSTLLSHTPTKTNHSLNSSDEEDILLYGQPIELCKKENVRSTSVVDSERLLPNLRINSSIDRPTEMLNISFDFEDQSVSKYFAFIVYTNGVLEIYSVPSFTLLYEVHRFSDLPPMLFDHRGLNTNNPSSVNVPYADDESIPPTILEILVYPIGANKDRPILMVRTDQEMAFFEALCPSVDESHPIMSYSFYEGGLQWRRLPIPCPLVAPRRVRTDLKIADVQSTLLTRSNMLRSFENIGQHRGVFVCGGNPVWIFGTDSGQLRVFPHSIDGIMGSFSPLNASICHSGFVYLTYSNEMRLATLPPGYSFNEPLGMKWISLDFIPYFIQYHVESKTYAVVGIQSKPCSSVYRLNAEGNKEEDVLSRPNNCVLPSLDYYSLQMYAPNIDINSKQAWEIIPNTHKDFEPWEVVTCLITAQLTSEETFHGTKDYLALGANLSYGEEIPVRGRILILDVIDVVPEPGQPLTRHKLKLIHNGEQKGPVTALTSCQGHLIGAVGQKIYIWTLKNAGLVGVAFVDSELYIHNLLCVKNLVLAADVLKSIQLLRFQSDLRVLSVVSRDNIAREVHTASFFVDGRRLGFMVTDENGNLVIYSYDPLDPASRSGRRLVRRADMRLPSRATCCVRVANRLRHALLSAKSSISSGQTGTTTGLSSTDATNVSTKSNNSFASVNVSITGPKSQQFNLATNSLNLGNDPERLRHSVYFGTQNGAIYRIGPIRDKMFSRLKITERNLIHYLGPTCGMPPKLCWQYRRLQPELANPCGKVGDGDLIWRYLTLPHGQRLEIAKKSGQSLEGIMDDIAELVATTLHF